MTLGTGRSSTCGDSFASPKTDSNNQLVVPTSAHAANGLRLKSPVFLHKDFSCPYQNQYFNASPSSHHQWWFMARKVEVMQRLSLGIKPQCSAWTQLAYIIEIRWSQESSYSIRQYSEVCDARDCRLNSHWGYQAIQESPLSNAGLFFPFIAHYIKPFNSAVSGVVGEWGGRRGLFAFINVR